MFQIIFNELSAAEMSALPKRLQLDLLAEFQILPEDLDNLDASRFGVIEREGKKLHRYRAKDYRIYFEKRAEGITVHRVLHKNTFRDFRGCPARPDPRVLEVDRARRTDQQGVVIAQLAADEALRRREFPICARKIYCAHAADAPLPRRVADAMRDSIERASTDARQYEVELAAIAKTRELVARFLGAQVEEISFTGPTSSGLNVIANGLDWEKGDEVVCYLDDYPANVYPWLALERHGVKPVLLETASIGEIMPEIVERALTDRTKLVALSSANYCSGYRIDLETIGALCAERGVLFSVDAIQTLGVFPVALGNIDFLSAGAQKWMLGPSGAGILFVKESRHDLLRAAGMCNRRISSPSAKSSTRPAARNSSRAPTLTMRSPDCARPWSFFWKPGPRKSRSRFVRSRNCSASRLRPQVSSFSARAKRRIALGS